MNGSSSTTDLNRAAASEKYRRVWVFSVFVFVEKNTPRPPSHPTEITFLDPNPPQLMLEAIFGADLHFKKKTQKNAAEVLEEETDCL